jgi:iron complex transport system substrate-binding protein
VASLVPAATEIVAAIGGQDVLVGISHECDHPPAITSLPRLTVTPIDPGAPGDEIDAQVRALFGSGRPVIAVDAATLRAVRPTVILTQSLCDVCAVGPSGVTLLAGDVADGAAVVPMTGRTVPGVERDILAIGEAIAREGEARQLVGRIEARLAAIAASAVPPAKRLLVVEWLEPLFLAGHWVPELVTAGGARPVGGETGAHSVEWTWSEVAAMRPEVIVIALCGMNVDRALIEWRRFAERNPAAVRTISDLGAPVWALDGNAYTSRPGPRMVEAAELFRRAAAGTDDCRLAVVRLDRAPPRSR